MNNIIQLLAIIIIRLFRAGKGDLTYFKNLKAWQKTGITILPNHFYQPVPELSSLNSKNFSKRKSLFGIQPNLKKQIGYLKIFTKFKREFLKFKVLNKSINTQKDPGFYFKNYAFDGVDALAYYSMIRHLKPKKILEVGSGWSTKIAASASQKNKNTVLEIIEPYPQKILTTGFPGLKKLIKKKVQEVPVSKFKNLEKNDILFIDSSHTVKTGSDVVYLFLEVLPQLKTGVYVHIHDIFLPYDYPKSWVMEENRFWNEQYLLHAILINNSSFEIIYSNSMLKSDHEKLLRRAFPNSPFYDGGSFWIKKIR